MKKIIFSIITLTFLNSAHAYTGFGVCNYGKETVDSVICYGPTVLVQTTVTGNIKVTGSLQAENISVKNLVIEGSVDIKNSEVKGTVNIAGALMSDHVEYKKGVAVTSDKITLNNTRVNGLMTVTSKQNSPYLQVQCNSVITGAVLFDGKAGVVQITGDSLVQGKVVNGSLEFVKRTCK
jgi:hypothetical protein